MQEDAKMKFGEYIKQKRNEKGYSQKELAKRIGISASYVCQIEKGNRENISIKVVNGLYRNLEIDLGEVIMVAFPENKDVEGDEVNADE